MNLISKMLLLSGERLIEGQTIFIRFVFAHRHELPSLYTVYIF